jgi:fructokinase
MHKILCIGEALIDMICTDKGFGLSDGENFLKRPGGAPTNVAAAIAALGGAVTLAAKVGKDPFGQQLIQVMNDFGVDTNWMLNDDKNFTSIAFVSLLKNGERDFVFNRGADGQLSTADLAGLPVEDFSIIHFGSATGFLPGPLQTTYKDLLETAKAKNIFISFDPNYRHLLFPNDTESFITQSWYFLKNCDFFKLSDEEALLITKTNTIEKAVAALMENTHAFFAITIGAEGTIFRKDSKSVTVPSISIEPVDTTGAGDAFVGALLYQLSEKSLAQVQILSMEHWIALIGNANKAGARTCKYLGAMEAFKHLSSDIFN